MSREFLSGASVQTNVLSASDTLRALQENTARTRANAVAGFVALGGAFRSVSEAYRELAGALARVDVPEHRWNPKRKQWAMVRR